MIGSLLRSNSSFKRQISTLSPLASIFNQINTKTQKSSLFKNRRETGLFDNKELITFEGFYNLKDQVDKDVNRLLNEALNHNNANDRKLVQIFDDISNSLCKLADLSEFVRTSHPNNQYREAANYAFAGISQIVEKLNTNLELYKKLRQSFENDVNLDDCDKRVTKLYLIDFEQSGIHLDERSRLNYVRVNSSLIDVLMKFQENSQIPSEVMSNQLDSRYQSMLKYQQDPILVEAMYSNSSEALFREFVYKTYLKNNPLQESHFDYILRQRNKLSKLCGFQTYSHRSNSTMIMETTENTLDFLKLLSNSISSKALKDFDILKNFKKTFDNSLEPLQQWDVPYLIHNYKKLKYDLNKNDYRNYLSLGSCMDGLNIIVNSLFKINLEIEETQSGELWSDDVYKLKVKHETEGTLGYIYCDFYQRENKFSNVDCHYTIQCSKLLQNNTYQLPIVVLHLNFIKPKYNQPTLLTFEMMENLFHEFGHAIHSMLAKTRYQHVSGTRCSTDLAEVPSQLMEFFCREPKILKLYAKHYLTGEPLSDNMIHKLCESRKLFNASELQLQILHSILDQVFHGEYPLNKRPIDIVANYTRDYYHLPFVNDTYWHQRFSHFISYGSKYYSYLVSKAIATKIWSHCFANDPLSSTAGENYRHKFLSHGGERKPQDLIDSLIGFNVNNKSLVNSLVESL